jgi:predicted Fe-Mo cluster-binding NifX family protein
MKLCIPVEENNGLESLVYGHFGSAPCFLIWDSGTEEITVVSNQNSDHTHGACSPLKAIGSVEVDAVVVSGIGARAIERLNSMDIQVLQSSAAKVSEALECFKNNTLSPLAPANACSGHGGGGCGH